MKLARCKWRMPILHNVKNNDGIYSQTLIDDTCMGRPVAMRLAKPWVFSLSGRGPETSEHVITWDVSSPLLQWQSRCRRQPPLQLYCNSRRHRFYDSLNKFKKSYLCVFINSMNTLLLPFEVRRAGTEQFRARGVQPLSVVFGTIRPSWAIYTQYICL